ncbi:LacI family DNA-binding transcriptional regulator [Demequina sp. NBRC 110051]|uniref:LacI family DNA-binding transcriptional regulator n=1 Tax=Demequina sp. NBRC 110051 TaxID=1570340 RepID=UPI0011812DCB|nr:LacI family DNA-binding transcriptional regulator [Demequina sp. NBRC 110051]
MARDGRGPSMHDVAARAGVSHQTVSRVLNDFEGIRPETRERVMAAIEELGYRRNLAARALVTGRTQTIGMIGPVVTDIGPLSTLHALELSARAAGLHTIMTSTEATAAQVTEAFEFLLGRGIDALAVAAQHQEIMDAVDAVNPGIPVVHLLTGGVPQGAAAAIDQDAGVRLAMGHLLDLGHTRIQHVMGPQTYQEALLRRDAYEAVMRERGLEPLPLLAGDWTADSGFEAAASLDPAATAVFFANDQMALGALHYLTENGIVVPRDLSIVGFDDNAEARHTVPPLTTVRQDFAGVGRLAVDILVAMLARDPLPSTQVLEPELVVRYTTAPRA